MSDRKVAPNVMEFINRAAEEVGQMESDRFSQEMFSNAIDVGMESPIEDLFWTACQALCRMAYEEVNPTPDFNNKTGEVTYPSGVYIEPQARVGKYRVDFRMSIVRHERDSSPIVVELNGHDFHDKDKKQRSYEKARDRMLVKDGYRVVHYTGSDVVADPFKVAWEVLEMLGMLAGYDGYSPADPLQRGV